MTVSSQPIRILVAEDEPKISDLLRDYLNSHGFDAVCVADGLQVIPTLKKIQPQLLLLDIMLPGRDGMDICREIRQFSQIPIIMVTARVEEIDRVLGLELGADDYVCKPFSPREVVARVKANLRRVTTDKRQSSPETGFDVDVDRREIRHHGRLIPLTGHEFNLLAALLRRPGWVFSRDQLLLHMSADGRVVTDRTVDSHIKNIRRKIQAVGGPAEVIRSIYGVGYKLDDTL